MKTFTKLITVGGLVVAGVAVTTGPLAEWNSRREGLQYLQNIEKNAKKAQH
ncbi:hypothetical protein SDRG_11503 [Saprolegnia diclina VS20]|uniref:Uncharacterized protein n=2 Tax=Saprolegnia TaxID=4769 RepID=A0A067CXQ5_SAPPC|nr:hypothetical protein SDRG_11503 [Saprolegnia diclina VS20]XP_012193614.1 hypothetical protein SPRG_00109 [Saprolegnia parasitica CBS 223.65]EQC30744.1 hypothetical protein SDRG_11503 [Saprolegnia diclina VS20]KDO35263.1 hypothetical protein SPRG_00109 [Saprolegnia parasitica CBS 223.65]|eukprot:XP_008615768.1 hypothetical protein SDRG_11503 [Saprolegnia diclina VS20]